MVAYWAVDRQGLQEAAAAGSTAAAAAVGGGGVRGTLQAEADVNATGKGNTTSGEGRGGESRRTNGLLGANTAAGEEDTGQGGGGISDQERAFLGIVARYWSIEAPKHVNTSLLFQCPLLFD